jgi:hypothetical protein
MNPRAYLFDENSLMSNLTWDHDETLNKPHGLFGKPHQDEHQHQDVNGSELKDDGSLFSTDEANGGVTKAVDKSEAQMTASRKKIISDTSEPLSERNKKIRENVLAALRDEGSLISEFPSEVQQQQKQKKRSVLDKVMDDLDETDVKNKFKPKHLIPKEFESVLADKNPDDKLRLILHLADQLGPTLSLDRRDKEGEGDELGGLQFTSNTVLEAVMKKNLAKKIKASARKKDDTRKDKGPAALPERDANRLVYRNAVPAYRASYTNDRRIMDPWMLEKSSSVLAEASDTFIPHSTSMMTSGPHLDDQQSLKEPRKVEELSDMNEIATGVSSVGRTKKQSKAPMLNESSTCSQERQSRSDSDYGLALFEDLKVDERLQSVTKVIDDLEQARLLRQEMKSQRKLKAKRKGNADGGSVKKH